MDETKGIMNGMSQLISDQPKEISYAIFPYDQIKACAERYVKNPAVANKAHFYATWEEDLEEESKLDTPVKKADTLEELASQLGFQGEAAETFLATVARYNELCEKGQDEDFGKAAEKMHPLTTGPFRAITYDTLKHTSVDDVSCMRLLVTMGGLVTDDCARVLDDASSPIPGLYAVGNTQGGRFVDDYPFSLSGASHGAALTYGYLAGKQIALD